MDAVHITLQQPNGLSAMEAGRLKKAMSEVYRFSNGDVMEMREYIRNNAWTHKHHTVQEYSNKRVHLEYVKLKTPKHIYSIYNGRVGIDVPKMFWDLIDNLPEL